MSVPLSQVKLFIQRLLAEFTADLRTPCNYKDALALRSVCGGFLHWERLLRNTMPEAECLHHAALLRQQFLTSVIIQEAEKQASAAADAKEEELGKKVAQATAEQLCSKLEADLQLLRSRVPGDRSRALAAAQDVKYVRDRQRQDCCYLIFARQGNEWVIKWLEQHCQMHVTPDDAYPRAVSNFAKCPRIPLRTRLCMDLSDIWL